MRTIHLQVSRAEIDEGVALITAYHGVKSTHALPIYDRVAVVGSDDQWMGMAFDECCAQADLMLREYRSDDHRPDATSPTHYHAWLRMPDNWDDSQGRALHSLLCSFFVASVTAKWMAVTLPEQENHYAALAAQTAAQCQAVLHARRRPLPPLPPNCHQPPPP